jgi:hypothetical protein
MSKNENIKLTFWHYWVLSAVSNNDETYSYTNINDAWVKDGWLVGTTGRRVHMIRTHAEDGVYGQIEDSRNYLSKMEHANIDRKPDINSLLPQNPEFERIRPSDLKVILTEDFLDVFEIGAGFYQIKYIMSAFLGSETMDVQSNAGQYDPLLIRSVDGNRQALIMGLRYHTPKINDLSKPPN